MLNISLINTVSESSILVIFASISFV